MGQNAYIPMPAGRIGQPGDQMPANVSPPPSISGHGSPEGVIPGPVGWRYTDLDTGNFWMKVRGSQENGWEQRGTAGSAGVQVIG